MPLICLKSSCNVALVKSFASAVKFVMVNWPAVPGDSLEFSSTLTVGVQTAASGCTTSPGDLNVMIQFRSQWCGPARCRIRCGPRAQHCSRRAGTSSGRQPARDYLYGCRESVRVSYTVKTWLSFTEHSLRCCAYVTDGCLPPCTEPQAPVSFSARRVY